MPSRATIFWLIVMFSAVFVQFVESLKPGIEGVCTAKISVRKTRAKMVTINKWCGKKKCVVRKVESYTVPEDRVVCCKGWEYNVDTDSCGPICSTGCVGGRCISPEVCHCDPPTTLDPDHKNACLQPKCNPQCVNALCGPENTCNCLPDFSRYNSTHCFQCDPGFVLNEDFTCSPVCEESCINSECTAPNTCSCLDGYKKVNGSACEPICDDICVNSTCVGPNNCSCLEGYERYNDTSCVPICENCSGICVAPNECMCPSGFINTNRECKPECGKCDNGTCVSPGVCSCNEGFVKNGSDSTSCVKVKNCDQPTVEEVSVSKTTYSRVNIKSKCPKGTSECTWKEKQSQHINPKTTRCCKKSFTVKENRISCCSGWVWTGKTDDKCVPQCRSGCENGRCVAPEKCECDPPLILDNNKCVEPVCDPDCVNGKCVNNNTCACDSGYHVINSTYCAVDCQDGYTNNNVTLECSPVCDSPCVNASCTAPNICTCKEGYTHSDDFNCVPECKPSCKNANCIAPNTCECIEGYKENESVNGTCEPVCEQPCRNGSCSAPNVCKCNDGFEPDPKNKFDCIPICETKCINASCVSPNTCSCYDGYESAGNNWTCKPKCEHCDNGECIKPNVCACHEGYMKINGTCSPFCETPCSNGVCSQPNTCTCDKGYIIDVEDKFVCLPICEPLCINSTCISPNTCSCLPGHEPSKDSHICQPKCSSCHHGECVAPDTCACHKGYAMVDGNCSPLCTVACINANCTAPDTCTCIEGYETMSASVCHKPCLNYCEHGVCSLHGICRCDPGYRMFNDTCTEIPPVICSICEGKCSAESCKCSDGRPCIEEPEVEAEVSSTTGLAGMELPVTVGGAIVLLLLTLLVVVIHRLYRKRKNMSTKEIDDGNRYGIGSVVYTVPDTLIQRPDINEIREDEESEDNDSKTDRLLTEIDIKEDKL